MDATELQKENERLKALLEKARVDRQLRLKQHEQAASLLLQQNEQDRKQHEQDRRKRPINC